jgi:hypothetical protein
MLRIWTALYPVDDDSKKVENRRQHDVAKRRRKKIEPGDDGATKQKCEAKRKQKPRVKEKFAVADREVTVHRAKENKEETMGRVEPNPCLPHGDFSRDDR